MLPGFFMEKLRRKKAGKKQKFSINAVTYRIGLQRITTRYPLA
jgi:hypothetical protein